MNIKIRRRLSITAAVLWMILIFWFSAQPSNTSGEMSMDVGRFIGKLVIQDYNKKPLKEQDAFAKDIEYVVRKTAHATEYAILGVLLWQVYLAYGKRERQYLLSCILLGVAYASTDEFHQLFVAGRSGRFTDVMIDSGGVAAGVLLSFFICKAAKKRR